LSLVHPFITDDFVHIAFFTYSDYWLPVKHPCSISPTIQVEHISGNPEAACANHFTLEIAQGVCL
jgi:hypothetical protein